MNKRRVLIVVVVCVLALPLLVIGSLVMFFPTEQATAFAAQKLEESTGRRVQIGDSRIGIVPNIRLVLKDVAFGEKPEPNAPLITVESIELGMKLMPLFRQRVEVTRLAIHSPVVEAVLADEKTPPEKKAPAPAREGELELRIDELLLTDGRISVRTPDGRPFVEITGLEERLTASANAKGDLALSGTTRVEQLVLHVTEGEIGRGLPMTLTKSLRYDAASDRLEVLQAELDMAGVPMALAGTIDDVDGEMIASLVLAGGPGEIESILGLLPAGLFPELEGMQSSGKLALNARISGSLTEPEGPAFYAQVKLTEGRIQYPRLARAVEDITLLLEATPEAVEVTEFAARSASSTLRAHATIADYRTKPHVKLALDSDVDLGDIAVFYPAADEQRLAGRLTAQLIAEGPADEPEALTIDGTLETRDVTFKGSAMPLPIEALTGTAIFDRTSVTLQSASGRIGKSDFTLSGRLENPMALDTTRTGLGRARGTFNVRCNTLDVDELMPPPGAAASKAGPRIPELPPLDATVSATIGALRMKGLDARNVAGQLDLDNDVLTLRDVTADVFQGRAALDGSMALADRNAPTFDLTVDATSCNVVDVFSYNRDLGRLATVARHLTGTMSTKTTMKGALDDTLGLNIQTLASDGDVWVQKARLAQHPVQEALSTFLKSDRLKELGIEEIVQSFTIRDGRLRFDDLNLKAGAIEAVGNGWSAIDGRYEMTLDLWLPREIAEGARDKLPKEAVALFFGGTEERLMLPVKVAGERSGRPSVGLDAAKLSSDARARAQARLDAEKQRLREEAKKRAEEEAAKLLGGAKPDSVPIQVVAKEEVEEKVKDALKGLFNKKK